MGLSVLVAALGMHCPPKRATANRAGVDNHEWNRVRQARIWTGTQGTVTVSKQPKPIPPKGAAAVDFEITGGHGSKVTEDVILTPMQNGTQCGASVPVTVFYFDNGSVQAVPVPTSSFQLIPQVGFQEFPNPAVRVTASVDLLPAGIPDSPRFKNLYFGIEQNVMNINSVATYINSGRITWDTRAETGDVIDVWDDITFTQTLAGPYIDVDTTIKNCNVPCHSCLCHIR